jgi:hypothetical protein
MERAIMACLSVAYRWMGCIMLALAAPISLFTEPSLAVVIVLAGIGSFTVSRWFKERSVRLEAE